VGRVDLSSPLPVDVAEERLRSGLTERLEWERILGAHPDTRVVVGTVRDRKVRLMTPYGLRSAGRPQLRGRLIPTAGGCHLSGTLGLIRLARLLVPVVLTGSVVAALVGAGLLLASVIQGDGLGGHLPGFAIPAFVATGFVLGIVGDAPEGLADGEYLQKWVRERLQAG